MSQTTASTFERSLAAGGILLGIAGSLAVWYFNPSTARFFPICPLYALTGLSCPGCGLTRGFHALFHGDIGTALHFNVLLPFYILIFAYVFVSLLLIVWRGRGLSFRLFTPATVYGFLTLSLLFGVLRNLPFYPFTFFSL
ncbi:MAG: DUF2752 domain-containing protein [Pyrinomonadaceae bacterium]